MAGSLVCDGDVMVEAASPEQRCPAVKKMEFIPRIDSLCGTAALTMVDLHICDRRTKSCYPISEGARIGFSLRNISRFTNGDDFSDQLTTDQDHNILFCGMRSDFKPPTTHAN
jgi:hypothetical protein